jgi:hypothetical protein
MTSKPPRMPFRPGPRKQGCTFPVMSYLASHAAAMPFRSDFWVVVGTAAPVIVLAMVISVGSAIELITGLPPKGTAGLGLISYLLAGVTLAMQFALFLGSLLSLAVGSDVFSKTAAAVLEILTVAALFMAAFIGGVGRVYLAAAREKAAQAKGARTASDWKRAVYRR